MANQLNQAKFPVSMRILHWLMAVIIIGLIAAGSYMTPWSEGRAATVDPIYYYHKSFGLVIFILVWVRLAIRSRSQVPELPASLPTLDRRLADAAKVLFYLLMILQPIMGYVQSSSYEYSDGVNFFVIDLPEVIPKSEVTFEISNRVHRYLGYTLLGIILLHIIGVVKHRFFDKNKENDVLSRML